MSFVVGVHSSVYEMRCAQSQVQRFVTAQPHVWPTMLAIGASPRNGASSKIGVCTFVCTPAGASDNVQGPTVLRVAAEMICCRSDLLCYGQTGSTRSPGHLGAFRLKEIQRLTSLALGGLYGGKGDTSWFAILNAYRAQAKISIERHPAYFRPSVIRWVCIRSPNRPL